jgi:hypothetical protein
VLWQALVQLLTRDTILLFFFLQVASLATHAKVMTEDGTADGNGPVEEDENGIVSRAPVYDIDKQEDRRELLQASSVRPKGSYK